MGGILRSVRSLRQSRRMLRRGGSQEMTAHLVGSEILPVLKRLPITKSPSENIVCCSATQRSTAPRLLFCNRVKSWSGGYPRNTGPLKTI
jgi:hypothetical protein